MEPSDKITEVDPLSVLDGSSFEKIVINPTLIKELDEIPEFPIPKIPTIDDFKRIFNTEFVKKEGWYILIGTNETTIKVLRRLGEHGFKCKICFGAKSIPGEYYNIGTDIHTFAYDMFKGWYSRDNEPHKYARNIADLRDISGYMNEKDRVHIYLIPLHLCKYRTWDV